MRLVILLLKTIGVLFLLISASLLCSSSAAAAGRRSGFARIPAEKVEAAGLGGGHEDEGQKEQNLSREEVMEIHQRLLKVNTKDYGRYDPAPALGKPPFKLIPN